MWSRVWDLIVVAALATAGLAITALGPSRAGTWAAIPAALVLILPGYALSTAIFPTRGLRKEERLVYSIGLSLATGALAGLLLNALPSGLQAGSWATLLAGITLAASTLGVARRARATRTPRRPALRLELSLGDGLLLGLAALVAVAAVLVARMGAERQLSPGFTELWLVPLEAPNASAVQVGIGSREGAATRYALRIEQEGQLVQEWPSLSINSGDDWATTIELPAAPPAGGSVEAILYRLDEPGAVYRRVVLRRGGEPQ
jgi:hypothetical protein